MKRLFMWGSRDSLAARGSIARFLAWLTASMLTVLPVLVFNGPDWYPSVDFYKWCVTFIPVAYGAGTAAFLLLAEKGGVRVTRIELAWLALVLLSALQPFILPLRSFGEWVRNAYFFAALGGAVFVLRNLPIDAAMPGILRSVAAAGGLSTLFGFTQNLAPRMRLPFILDAGGAPGRFLGNTGLDNLLGAYLALAIISGVWLLIYDYGPPLAPRKGRKLFISLFDFALLAVNFAGLWKTGARSAFVACALGLLALMLILVRVSPAGSLKKFLKLSALILLLGGCAALVSPDALRVERRDMSRLFSPETLSLRGEGRYSIWLTSWEMIKGSPLLGVGLGNYKWNYLDAMAVSREKYALPPRYTRWAHSEYLQWIAETGVVGAALFFSLLLYCAGLGAGGLLKANKNKTRETYENRRKISSLAWSLSALTVLAADSCFSRPLHHVDTAFVLSLALALISRLGAAPVNFPSDSSNAKARWAAGGAVIAAALSGLVIFAQSFQDQAYLSENFYDAFYVTPFSSEERERAHPLLLEDAYLQLTARENYVRTLFNLEPDGKDAVRLLSRCFETQPGYEELNLLMLLYQRQGEFEKGRRYFKYYPPEERAKFLRAEFDGRYMLD